MNANGNWTDHSNNSNDRSWNCGVLQTNVHPKRLHKRLRVRLLELILASPTVCTHKRFGNVHVRGAVGVLQRPSTRWAKEPWKRSVHDINLTRELCE